MSYLNLDFDFFDHPKTRRLRGILGQGSETLILRIWAHCGKFHPNDGVLTGYSVAELEEIAGWRGEQGKAIDALITVGLLKQCSSMCSSNAQANASALQVHDWCEHQGHISMLKDRAKAAAAVRWGKKTKSDAQAMLKHQPSNAISNAPFQSVPIQSNPVYRANKLIQRFKDQLSVEFKRKPMLVWPQREEQALADICIRPNAEEELREVFDYRKMNAPFFPRSISSLLEGWDKTLDQARNHDSGKPPEPESIAVREMRLMAKRALALEEKEKNERNHSTL